MRFSSVSGILRAPTVQRLTPAAEIHYGSVSVVRLLTRNAPLDPVRSPAGKAMVEKVPVAMQKASTLMQARIGPMTEKVQAMVEQFQKDLQKAK